MKTLLIGILATLLCSCGAGLTLTVDPLTGDISGTFSPPPVEAAK